MSISDSKIRCSIVIEKKNKYTIEDIAKKRDRSVNYVINQAIKEYIQKTSPEPEGIDGLC